MRLITDTELTKRTDVELAILYQVVANALGHTQPGTPDRGRAIESLQNINKARSNRHNQCTVPGF
jgi:spore maturation protein SpmA